MDEEGEHGPMHPGVYILLLGGKRRHENDRNMKYASAIGTARIIGTWLERRTISAGGGS